MKHLICLLAFITSGHVFADAAADFQAGQNAAASVEAQKYEAKIAEAAYAYLGYEGKVAANYQYSEGAYLMSKVEVCKYQPQYGRRHDIDHEDESLSCVDRPYLSADAAAEYTEGQNRESADRAKKSDAELAQKAYAYLVYQGKAAADYSYTEGG